MTTNLQRENVRTKYGNCPKCGAEFMAENEARDFGCGMCGYNPPTETVREGSMLEYSNHAGKHMVEYVREVKDGKYTTLIGKWNGFDEEVEHKGFRYMGVMQNGWKVLSNPPTETVSDKLINDFIGRWVKPENRPYLLDDDDNPGQRLREAISDLLQKERIEGYKDGYIKGGINQAKHKFFVEDEL